MRLMAQRLNTSQDQCYVPGRAAQRTESVVKPLALLPKQSTCVCYDQLDALAVAELPNAQLFLQTGGGQHNHLHREGKNK